LAHYILELSLLQPRFLNYPSSLKAASVIYLIKKIRKSESSWTTMMTTLVGYEEKELKLCAKDLCSLLECSGELEAKSIRDKFSLPSFHEVTRIKLERKEKK
jgi:G2/mitotic-specific cyclin-B, other